MSSMILFVILYVLLPSFGISLILFSFKKHIENRYRSLFNTLSILPLLAGIVFTFFHIIHKYLSRHSLSVIYYIFLVMIILYQICLWKCSVEINTEGNEK